MMKNTRATLYNEYMNKRCPPREELIDIFNRCRDIHEVAIAYGVSWSTVRCWLTWLKISFRPSKKTLLSDCRHLTDLEIAKKYKVSDKTVTVWKKQKGISKKKMKIENLPAELSDVQNNLITGKLLGDSWIEKIRAKKTITENTNTSFGVEHCKDAEEYVRAVHDTLLPFSLPTRHRTRKNVFKTKQHHKEIIRTCLFNTVRHPIFKKLREKWYPEGIKVVPRDIDLNWQVIAFWFCDDGSNRLGKRCVRNDGVLCTNSFSKEDVEFLINKLEEKGVKCHIGFDREQPMIHLHKDTFKFFIDNIKPFIPWECMQYKLLY